MGGLDESEQRAPVSARTEMKQLNTQLLFFWRLILRSSPPVEACFCVGTGSESPSDCNSERERERERHREKERENWDLFT